MLNLACSRRGVLLPLGWGAFTPHPTPGLGGRMATLNHVALLVSVWIVASLANAGVGEQAIMGGQSHLCPATPSF